MRINSISTISQPQIYNKHMSIFQSKSMTLKKAETFVPEFNKIGIWNKLKLMFTDLKPNLLQEILNQDKRMRLLQIGSTERRGVFNSLAKFTDFDSYRKALYSLTQGNIPKSNAKMFLSQRLEASSVSGEFIQDRFDLFNNLYNNCSYDSEFDEMYIRCIVDYAFRGRNIDKNKAAFALKWIGQKGCYDIANSIRLYTDADELYEYGLPKFTDFLKIINSGYIPSERQINAFKYMYPKMPKDTEFEKLCSVINKCTIYKDASENLLNFAVEKFDDKNLDLYLNFALSEDKSDVDDIKIKRVSHLIQSGMNDYTALSIVFKNMGKYINNEEPWAVITEVMERTSINNSGYLTSIINTVTDNEGCVNREALEKLLRVYETALKSKETLRIGNNELTNEDIAELIFDNPEKTLNTLSLLGEKTFVYSFGNKIDEVEYYIEDLFGDVMLINVQPLLEIINPIAAFEYQSLEGKIKNLKKEFNNLSGKQKEECINEINTMTKRKNQMIKNSIHDPKEALDLAIIYIGLINAATYLLDEIIPYMNPKTEEEKQKFYEILNNLLLKSIDINKFYHQKVLDKIDFSKSRYLPQLFNSDSDFSEAFEKLLDILAKEPDKSNLNIFNSLPQNKETRVMFKKLGINYKQWTTFNPESKIQISVNLNAEHAKQSIIKNLEEDLTGQLFLELPEEQREILTGKLKEQGFELRTVKHTLHDGLGYAKDTIYIQKFFKDDEMIDVKGAKQIISLIKEEINSNEFWTRTLPNARIQSLKETFKDHILNIRYNEVKNILDIKSDKDINIVVQKADMNDIKHALFLGNDAGCCTAVDASNGYSAVTYIMNKFISAIELKDGERFIGNTMCYFANVDGEPALVLDNIEMKSRYQYNDKIRDVIFNYADKLCAEIGKPDLPIYLGPNRHKINLYNYEFKERKFEIIGSSGDDKIYLDFDANGHYIKPNNQFETKMYKIR